MKGKALIALGLLIAVVLMFSKPPAKVQAPDVPAPVAAEPAMPSTEITSAPIPPTSEKAAAGEEKEKPVPVYEAPIQGNILVM